MYYNYIGKDNRIIETKMAEMQSKLDKYSVEKVVHKNNVNIADYITCEELLALATSKKTMDPLNVVKHDYSYKTLMKLANELLEDELKATKNFNKMYPHKEKYLNAMEKLNELHLEYGLPSETRLYEIIHYKDFVKLEKQSLKAVQTKKDLSDDNLLDLFNAAKFIKLFHSDSNLSANIKNKATDLLKEIGNMEFKVLPQTITKNFPHLVTDKENEEKYSQLQGVVKH